MELHSGKLEMDSELGKGTQVTVILPLDDSQQGNARVSNPPIT
ncbi:hypothetical protein ACFTAO_25260 [Paenibacillus rhizoplanae]